MDITCPHCHQRLEGDISLVGANVTCPSCGREFTIPKLVALGGPVCAVNRGQGNRHPWKRLAVSGVLFLLFCVLFVWIRYELKYGIGQHPEEVVYLNKKSSPLERDGRSFRYNLQNSSRVWDHYQATEEEFEEREKLLVEEFYRDFWPDRRREATLFSPVPWACLMSREQQRLIRFHRYKDGFQQAQDEFEEHHAGKPKTEEIHTTF